MREPACSYDCSNADRLYAPDVAIRRKERGRGRARCSAEALAQAIHRQALAHRTRSTGALGPAVKERETLAANDQQAVKAAPNNPDCPVSEVWGEGQKVAAID